MSRFFTGCLSRATPDRREVLLRSWIVSCYLEYLESGQLLQLRSIRQYAAGDSQLLSELLQLHADRQSNEWNDA